MPTADVILIGGGIMGASAAYHLARRGAKVVVLEREKALGGGSTGRATGGFRAQFATDINVRLSLFSRAKLERFRDETGVEPGYRPCGYLLVASSERELEALRAAQAVQRAAGLHEAREVTVEEALRLNPAISPEGLVGGVFCPTDGFTRPLEILRGYAEASRRLGVTWVHDAEVTSVKKSASGAAVAVVAKGDRFFAQSFVDTAGAWAGPVARLFGVEIPVTPARRLVAITRPFPGLPETMPMTIFVTDGFHLRVRDGRVLLLMSSEGFPSAPFATEFAPGWLDRVIPRARAAVPVLRDAVVDVSACWGGLYEMSPDNHALLGRAPGVENLYLVNGSSGHGVMHSPALGELVSEIVLDGKTTSLDTRPLRPERFQEGEPNPRTEFL